MYTSFTLAIPADNPRQVAQWYKEYLGLSDIMIMGDDVYELQIMDNLWIQFYSSSYKAPLIMRLGVDELTEIINAFKQSGKKYKIGQEMEGIRYIYSQDDPWGHKIGFYEIQNKGEI